MATLTKKIVLAAVGLLSVAASTNPASAADRRIYINNYSDSSVYSFYVSNVGSGSWGRDQLGSGTIGSNRSMLWNIDDGSGYCRFDFKFVMADGSTRWKYNYNVCANSNLNVVD